MKKNFILSMLSFVIVIYSFSIEKSVKPVVDGDRAKTAGKAADAPSPASTATWEFYSAFDGFTPEELAAARSHKLGKEIGCLYDTFMDLYVVKEEVVPGDPARRTVIRKPGIYHAVRAAEKQIIKEVKNKKRTGVQAEEAFSHILQVAIAASDTESDSFEKALQENRKDPALLLALFNRVSLKNLY